MLPMEKSKSVLIQTIVILQLVEADEAVEACDHGSVLGSAGTAYT